MAKSTICLVRHGETEWNRVGRIQGFSDIPLNATGEAQAEALAERLVKEDVWHHVYCSDLVRARQTAERVAKRVGLTITADERLRERNLGPLEGKNRFEVQEMFGGADLQSIDWDNLPGVESRHHLQLRALRALTEIATRHVGQKIIVVSHGAFIKAFLEIAGELDLRNIRVQNTALNWVQYRDGERQGTNGTWYVQRYNDASHLIQTYTSR